MSDENNKQILLDELNILNSLNKVASTPDGKRVIDFILSLAQLDCDPHTMGKNSGETSNLLGKQFVGKKIIDKMIEAGVEVPANIFSKKNSKRIEEITLDLNKHIGGE